MEQPVQFLSAEKILALWESGRPQHALDRALTILAAASPGASRAALADLPIGERDARLLKLRALVFGPQAEAFTECPRCQARLEFPIDIEALGRSAPSHPADTPTRHETKKNGITTHFRAPTSRDLAAVVTAANNEDAVRLLVQRCSARKDLPNEKVEALGRAILKADPWAEITLHLTCPACAHEWDLLFDIVEFFWREISAQARRLLREIDALARAYGWTEREILSLPAQRRQSYLEMLAA